MLRELNLTPSHKWGQNFLVDPDLFEAIAVLCTEMARNPRVLEIGPGVGGLTCSLLEHGATVLAIEVDRRVQPALERLAQAFPGRLTTIYADALNVSWAACAEDYGFAGPLTVTGNLPYYVTAPLLGRLMDATLDWSQAVFMVQREVADRLLTHPGHRQTSTLGVLLRYHMEVLPALDPIPPHHFSPVPEVWSRVIQLKKHAPLPADWKTFQWVVKAGFQHRRKMLRQALSTAPASHRDKHSWQELLLELNISPAARAEELTLEQWTRLAAAVHH